MKTRLVQLALLFSLLGLMFFLQSCGKKNEPETPDPEDINFAVEIGDSKIPYIVINTTADILNEPKVAAEMRLYVKKQLVQTNQIGIEYRGSTSFRLSDKKSYGLETWDESGNDLNASFFNWPEEEDWILMGDVVNMQEGYTFDPTLMYHHFGYELSRQMGKYASRTKFVELELDGVYQGIYVFMEKLKKDGDRIDIATLKDTDIDGEELTGGYILKIDKTAGGAENIGQPLEYFLNNWEDDARYTAQNSFRSDYDVFGNFIEFEPYGEPYHGNQFLETYFIYEYPDQAEIKTEQKAYIQSYIREFEQALLADDFTSESRTYTDYLDINSFVDYFLINEICRNIDAYRLSTYVTKDKNDKLSMGPVWDLNIGFYNTDRIPLADWVINYNQHVESDAWMVPFWWPRLMEDLYFRDAVKVRWQSLSGSTLSIQNLHSIVDETANLLIDNGAIERNKKVWSVGGESYDQSIVNLKNYLSERISWMDSEISGF
ncbi:MAG: CotH kinase family protein [Marinoscillum sp.]